MIEFISSRIASWRLQRQRTVLHKDTLEAFRQGTYPEHPSIGLGDAYLQGLLEAKVLCSHAWINHALAEGPSFLEAWRKAYLLFRESKKSCYAPYLPRDVLDATLKTGIGWAAQSADEDPNANVLRVVQWVHKHNPQWLSSNLDSIFFRSSMSVWETMLYSDPATSRWAMQQWPERLTGQTFAWKEWISDTFSWTYPMFHNSLSASNAQWHEVANHLSAWSPLKDMEPLEQLNEAIALLKFHKAETNPHSSSNRGLCWKALTSNAPPELADAVGAALGCAWPDMHPDCLAIKRHFHPELVHPPWDDAASPPRDTECASDTPWLSSTRATLFLYDTSAQWVQAIVHSWEQQQLPQETVSIELPTNLFD